jgi:hypothetical protein
MARSVTEFLVFIASPGDLPNERDAARETVQKWNDLYSERQRVRYTAIMWETHAVPEMGDRAQAIINRKVDDCDLGIGLFWTRLGTPTGDAESGTSEEIERLIAAGKRVSIYFSAAPVDPYQLESSEFERLKAYRKACQSRGLLASFKDVDDLREQLIRLLSNFVEVLNKNGREESTPLFPQPREAGTGTSSTDLLGQVHDGENAPEEEESWFSLLRKGNYKKGMEVLYTARAKGDWSGSTLAEMEGFGYLTAFQDGGVYQAFVDLEVEAKAHPEKSELWFWYGLVLVRIERTDEAISAWNHVKSTASDPKFRRLAVTWIARTRYNPVQKEEALNYWRDELAAEKDPKGRAEYIARVAELYEGNVEAPEPIRATALREFALEQYPSDNDARTSLAWTYSSDLASPALGLLHYEDAVARDENNSLATINAGWTAQNLSLSLTSVRYYKKAKEMKEALAATNLGWQYLEAGFGREAEEMVAEARRLNPDHDATDRLAVAIRERDSAEMTRWKSTRERATIVRRWRARFAKAFLLPASGDDRLSGVYHGTPFSLLLSVEQGKQVSGSFQFVEGGARSLLIGAIEGQALTFSWKSIVVESSSISLLDQIQIPRQPTSGRGILVVSDFGLEGYSFRGQEEVDPASLEDFTEWKLKNR